MKKGIIKKAFAVIAGFFIALMITMPIAFAQYGAPSVLPDDDSRITGGLGYSSGSIYKCTNITTAIQTGQFRLVQTPCLLKFFSETLIAVAGSLAVIFVMIGGFKYIFGGQEKRDEAKKTVTHALVGLAVSLLAWIIVDVVLQFATE